MHEAYSSYSAEVVPDRRLRRLVLLSGAALHLAGLIIVPTLPLAATLRVALAIAWTGLCSYEWLAMWRGYVTGGRLRIDAGGSVERQCLDGTWESARLCAGSVVVSRFAWLRIAPPGMRPYAELVAGDGRESEDWRRLQVIWRHIGAA